MTLVQTTTREHTITEQVIGTDLVAAQLHIFQDHKLEQILLTQDKIIPRGVSIQCRITSEDVRYVVSVIS